MKLDYTTGVSGRRRGCSLRTNVTVGLDVQVVNALDLHRGGVPRNAIIEDLLIRHLEAEGVEVTEVVPHVQ